MKNSEDNGWLMRFASKVFKYFLLGLFGLLVVFLFSGIVGFLPLLTLLINVLKHFFMKFAITVLCIVGVAVVIESIR
jgi:hypothetical protein